MKVITLTEAIDVMNATFRAALVEDREGQLVLKQHGQDDRIVDFASMGRNLLKLVHQRCNAVVADRLTA